MILDYIALGLASLYLVASIICVIIEALDASPRRAGKFSRSLRCHLRDISQTPFITLLCLFMIVSSWCESSDIRRIFLAGGIFFTGVIIVHIHKGHNVLRSRRIKKNSSAGKLSRTALLSPSKRRELPLRKPANELVPLTPRSEKE